MISGRTDTWFTVEEFAAMVGRSEKTIMNWASEGRLQFAELCGVKLVALSMIENLITSYGPVATPSAEAALRIIGRRDRAGRRTAPERHPRQRPTSGQSESDLLPSSSPPVRSRQP